MIDTSHFMDLLMEGVEEGVKGSLNQIRNRARELAPVRQLFKGATKAPLRGPISVHNQTTFGQPYRLALRMGRVATRTGTYPIVNLTKRGHSGSQNTSLPTTRKLAALGNQRIMGKADDISFREIKNVNGTFEFQNTRVRFKIGGKLRLLDLRDEFIGQANRDLRSGRGLHTTGKGAAKTTEYGGTLRDSIEVVGPFRNITEVTGYVKAEAVEHGFNYAYAQEFGTAHNRPQPFLRPALRQFKTVATEHLAKSVDYRMKSRRGVRIAANVVSANVHILVDPGKTAFAQQVKVLNNSIDRIFEPAVRV